MTNFNDKVRQAKKYILKKQPKKDISKFICISLNEQKLWLVDKDNIIKTFSISSSKYGTGNVNESFQTPYGLHIVDKKIGDNLPINTILRGRKIIEGGITTKDLDDPKYNDFKQNHFKNFDDIITSRILWLKGQESEVNLGGDVDSFKRYIYIHGTIHEDKIGTKASHGCIRMKNKDVIELYELINEGIFVNILNDSESK